MPQNGWLLTLTVVHQSQLILSDRPNWCYL